MVLYVLIRFSFYSFGVKYFNQGVWVFVFVFLKGVEVVRLLNYSFLWSVKIKLLQEFFQGQEFEVWVLFFVVE